MRSLLLLGCLTTGLSACTILLGDDFFIGSAGGPAGNGGDGGSGAMLGGGGEGGGGGEQGGGGGGSPPLPSLSCHWELTAHTEVIDGPLAGFWGPFHAAARVEGTSSGVRAAIGMYDSDFTLSLVTVEGPIVQSSVIPGGRLLDLARLGDQRLGLLYHDATPDLRLRVIMDPDPHGGGGIDHVLAGPAELPGATYNLKAKVAVSHDPAAAWPARVFAAYQTASDWVETFIVFDGQAVTNQITVTPSGSGLNSNAASPTAAVVDGDKTWVFVGQAEAGVLPRLHELNDTAPAALSTRTIGPGGSLTFGAAPRSDGANVFMIQPNFQLEMMSLRMGSVPSTQLATFAFESLAAVEATDIYDQPFMGLAARWHGDYLVVLGASVNEPTTLQYLLFDPQGEERGRGTLPFTAGSTPFPRQQVNSVATAPASATFDAGGVIHVLWHEDQKELVGENGRRVAYHDRLVCAPR